MHRKMGRGALVVGQGGKSCWEFNMRLKDAPSLDIHVI